MKFYLAHGLTLDIDKMDYKTFLTILLFGLVIVVLLGGINYALFSLDDRGGCALSILVDIGLFKSMWIVYRASLEAEKAGVVFKKIGLASVLSALIFGLSVFSMVLLPYGEGFHNGCRNDGKVSCFTPGWIWQAIGQRGSAK